MCVAVGGGVGVGEGVCVAVGGGVGVGEGVCVAVGGGVGVGDGVCVAVGGGVGVLVDAASTGPSAASAAVASGSTSGASSPQATSVASAVAITSTIPTIQRITNISLFYSKLRAASYRTFRFDAIAPDRGNMGGSRGMAAGISRPRAAMPINQTEPIPRFRFRISLRRLPFGLPAEGAPHGGGLDIPLGVAIPLGVVPTKETEPDRVSLAFRGSLLGRLCGTVSWRVAFGSDFPAV